MSFGERFLHNPDLFPARRGGEAWGGREAVLDLPGGPYRFRGLSHSQEHAVRNRFGPFCREAGTLATAGAPAAVEVRVFRVAASDFRELDLRGWEYGLDMDFAPETVRLAGLRLLGRLDWQPGLTGALWTSEAEGEELSGVFENFFRVLAAYRILERGGVILHCAGVARAAPGSPGPGEACLFLGRSGAGKTTVSRQGLERGYLVLSDDLNAVVRPDGSALRVERLPFTGDLGAVSSAARSFPLRALFRLEKSADDRIRPLSRAEAVACLLACSPFVNVDPFRREALMAVLVDLAMAFPAFELHFSLAGGFWSILDRAWPPTISTSVVS